MLFRLDVGLVCPGCGCRLAVVKSVNDYMSPVRAMWCDNPECEMYGRRWKAPVVDLEEVFDA